MWPEIPTTPLTCIQLPAFARASKALTRLGTIIDAPKQSLWVRHCLQTIAILDRPMVAIVGARSCSEYGSSVAYGIAQSLARAGIVVVSGLARGIDAAAHRGAIDAGGQTIAVLGCGINRDYPGSHAQLAAKITETGGLIMSEYEPDVEPAPWRFPMRNRIVAGISQAVIVVEARERSGALITVDLALEMSRPVFAVPGEITSLLSADTNRLIAQGNATAIHTTDAQGIVTRFGEAL